MIDGTPKGLWPDKMCEVKVGMPHAAMWIQCFVVIAFVIMLTIGGDAAAKFFTILISMTNVAMTIPYMFIAGAFAPFKKNKEIAKTFTIFKSYKNDLAWTIIVVFTVLQQDSNFAKVHYLLDQKMKRLSKPVCIYAFQWFFSYE